MTFGGWGGSGLGLVWGLAYEYGSFLTRSFPIKRLCSVGDSAFSFTFCLCLVTLV